MMVSDDCRQTLTFLAIYYYDFYSKHVSFCEVIDVFPVILYPAAFSQKYIIDF